MKKSISLVALALAYAISTGASAMEVPTDTVVQNLNGSQQVVKTYTVAPNTDPQDLIEEPFVLEGYRYTFADIVKSENQAADTKTHSEMVTVETSEDDLAVILEQLAPTMEYDDGLYAGTLSLDHTSLHTEATGYSTRSYTVSETKTISQLDRNDMSYVPATTIKDDVTLNLAGVDWQVTGTDLVGEVLSPSTWQAVASYSGKAYYSAADGYITTAAYVGDITRSGIESVTYRITYLGAEDHSGGFLDHAGNTLGALWPYLLGGGGLAAIAVLSVMLARSRRETSRLRADQEDLLQILAGDDLEDEDDTEEERKE